MPLDYEMLAAQVGNLRESLITALGRRTENLGEALRVYRTPRAEPDWFGDRIAAAQSDWRFARPLEPPGVPYAPGPLPAEFLVVATDGSQIEADRHYGIECHLLNIGRITLRYGAYASGRLDVTSQILFDDDLFIANPDKPSDRQKLEGQLLAAKRAIFELDEVYKLAASAPAELPVLALQDGTLTLWNLLGSQHRQFVSQTLLSHEREGFLPVLGKLRELHERRAVVIAAYVSQSTNAEVVNLLRLLICDKQPGIHCADHCGHLRHPALPDRTCDTVYGVLDRDLFAELLDYGERSAVFQIESKNVKAQYGDHATCFFYLHVGNEIARVEIPRWLADRPDRVRLVHQLVLDQVERGLGYPAALVEAHERAVVRGADRDEFTHLMERELMDARPRLPSSEKHVSKRLRAL